MISLFEVMCRCFKSITMKKTIFLIFCLISSIILKAQKAFDEYLVDKNFIPFATHDEQTLPTSTADASVTVNASNHVNKVRQSIFGQNSVAWQGNVNPTASREQHWKNANFSLLRFPGGNWSNRFFWDGNTPSSIKTESAMNGDIANLTSGTDGWTLETDEFPDLLTHTGADGIVCVNVGYAFYGTDADPVTTAADYAAAWVNQYNVVQNLGIKYWELGNENYGPWQAGFDLATPQLYADACVIFAQKMKAVDPTIKIGVVLYEGEGGFNDTPQAKDWNEVVLPTVEDYADFLIIHHYPHPASNQNDISESAIYDAISVVDESMEMLHNQIETYTSKPGDYYPVATTEFNMRAGIRNMSRTNALFTTMMLAEYAKHDYGAVTQWDLQNGFNTETGDHGLVSSRDPFLDEGSVNPEFYAFYYMDKYFGDMVVGSSSSDGEIITYATTFATGELGLIVVNKGATDKVVDLNLNGYSSGTRMYWHTVDGDDSDFDRTVYVNGVGPSKTFVEGQSYTSNKGSNDNTAVATAYEVNGVSGPQDYASINPYSSLIPTGAIKFDAPKYSVSFIVFEGATTGCLTPELGNDVELCRQTSIVLDGSVASSSAIYSWSKDGASIGDTPTIQASTAGVYAVEVEIAGCPTVYDELTITSRLLDVTGDTACVSGETVDLKVIGESNVSWFDQHEGGVLLETGADYSPSITESTTFYVEDNNVSVQQFGKSVVDGSTYGNTGAGAYDNDNRTSVLTVEQAFTLESVTVFIQSSSADVVLNITGNGIDKTFTFDGLTNAGEGKHVLSVGEELTPGTYVLDLVGTTGGVKIQYDNAGSQSLTGIASFVTGGGNTTWYGMFFDWEVSTGGSCIRTPVEAVFYSQPGCITGSSSVLENELEIYPNPTTGLVFLSEEMPFVVYDLMGVQLFHGVSNTIVLSELSSGVYLIQVGNEMTRVIKQ